MFFLMTFKILLCYKNSLEMFKGKSSLSTTPLTNPKYSGINSSQSSMIKTLLTYNLMLFFFFLVSNKSKGALLGKKRIALNSKPPSTENYFTDKCSSQSLVNDLQKLAYSSLVISSAFLIHKGLFLLTFSYSVETSFIFFFLGFFSSSFSSLISPSSSFFSLFSSSSSSETSFSVVFSTYNSIGNPINSECFLIKSFNLLSSKNSKLSLFK